MLSRLAVRLLSRLVTGPLAFLLAGAVDVTAAWGGWAAGRVRARLTRRTTS